MSALDTTEETNMESTTPIANATSPSDTMSTTPAPTGSNSASTPSTSSSATRRPPRKSTLTQQQKNQKRQRATQDQLITLEQEFNKNPTPTASVRDRIAQEINMTERSVQIWFQNRRAKIKLIAKKSIETGEDCDAIPESYRQYLAMQAMESGKPLARYFPGRIGYPSGVMMNSDAANNSKVVIHHFNCRSLTIGSWRRVGQNAMDLVIFYSPDKACITYYINNDSAGYKIEYPFSSIKNITLESGEGSPNSNGIPPRPAGLVIELNRPPNFFMDSSNSGGFYQCGDFTEDQQASQIMMHHLGGHPKVLSVQLAKLVSLESFQNRLMPVAFDMGMNMPPAMAASAPVSPNINRPSSQPSQLPVFQENPYAMGFPGARGHKRQRSRSVPAAIDVSMFHQPMPSFHIQHPSQQFVPDPNIFQPIPQYQNPQQNLGPNLRIDTSSQYGMEFRNPYPMSATTTASPSDYASPGLYGTGAPSENGMTAASFNTPYSMPFLSPSPMVDPSNMIPPSVSPLSSVSHHEPMIADQSPPLNGMHRSASADMFQFPHHDHSSAISDDGLMLSEMYSKQNLNMHVATPEGSTPGMQMYDFSEPQGSSDGMDLPDLMPFETIDPANLNP